MFIYVLIVLVSISPVFWGLFFELEASIVLAAAALLSSLYFAYKLITKNKIHFNRFFAVTYSILIFAYLISFVNVINIKEALDEFIRCLEYFIITAAIFDYFNDKKAAFFKTFSLSVFISGFICSLTGLEAYTSLFPGLQDMVLSSRLGSTFQYCNTAAVLFAISLIFALSWIDIYPKAIVRSIMTGAGSIIFLALILTGSRGGYLVLALMFLLFLILVPGSGHRLEAILNFISIILPSLLVSNEFLSAINARDNLMANILLLACFIAAASISFVLHTAFKLILKFSLTGRLLTAALLIIIILALFFVFVPQNWISMLIPEYIIKRVVRQNDPSYSNRILYYRDAIEIIKGNWLTGLGGGAWESLYQSVQQKLYIANETHNHYLNVFIEAGIIGISAFVVLIVKSIINYFRAYKRTVDKSLKTQHAGLLCAFLCLVLHSAIDFDLSFVSMYLLFWVLAIGGFIQNSESPVMEGQDPAFTRSVFVTKSRTIKLTLIIISAGLVFVNGAFSISAYNARVGEDHVEALRYAEALPYYERAYDIDKLNPEYAFELAKLYNLFAESSINPEDANDWRKEARGAAKVCVLLDRYNPTYRELMAISFSQSGMPVQALAEYEKLVENQPCKPDNYSRLAAAYIKAADYYIKNGNKDYAKNLLKKCIELAGNKYADIKVITQYTEEAAKIMDNLIVKE
jgi:tetratricopeptide (TPR) repeat protein